MCVGGRDVSRRLKKHLHPPVGLFCISGNHMQPGMVCVFTQYSCSTAERDILTSSVRLPTPNTEVSRVKTRRFHPRTDP